MLHSKGGRMNSDGNDAFCVSGRLGDDAVLVDTK
jgi:hypothetical protein